MIRYLSRLLACLAAALALPAAATTHSPDYTDLWYLPAESGWGINIIQQNDTVFATLFVYGSDGTPRWYVAPALRSVASPPGENLFSGSLFSTLGTFYGAPWGGPTTNAQVGTLAISFSSPSNGAISYTVNGVVVTKSIVRQTWANNVLTGNYIGGLTANGTNCRNNVPNGPILISGDLTIGHSNFAAPIFRVDFFNANGGAGTCTFTGSYAQDGRLGRVNSGTYSCQIQGVSNPPVGTFTLSQIEANVNGITARFVGSDQNCNYDGYFGGTRDVL
jgi:hypothetical protein